MPDNAQSPLSPSGTLPIFLLEAAVPVLSLGGALLALVVSGSDSTIDIRYFGIGCVLGSFILAYLAWTRPHKDIVALSTPIYSFLFFVIPSDIAVTLVLEFLYAASLTILLIRLKLRFGPAPILQSGNKKLLPPTLTAYCESVDELTGEVSHEVRHYAAVVVIRFSEGEYQHAVHVADAALAELGSSFPDPPLNRAFGIVREQALLLEASANRPDPFLEFLPADSRLLIKPVPPADAVNARYETALENALLLLFAVGWNGSERDHPLLLTGQSFTQKLIES